MRSPRTTITVLSSADMALASSAAAPMPDEVSASQDGTAPTWPASASHTFMPYIAIATITTAMANGQKIA